MRRLLLAPLLFILFYSCHDPTKEEDKKLKSTITSYLNDEFFRKNLTLELVDLKIFNIVEQPMDSIITKSLKNTYLIYFIEYKNSNPDWVKSPLPDFQNVVEKDPKWIKFKQLKTMYSSSDIGKTLYAYIKGTRVSNIDNSRNNFILDSTLFIIDSKYKVIETSFRWKNQD